jgi:hypothetical protein
VPLLTQSVDRLSSLLTILTLYPFAVSVLALAPVSLRLAPLQAFHHQQHCLHIPPPAPPLAYIDTHRHIFVITLLRYRYIVCFVLQPTQRLQK